MTRSMSERKRKMLLQADAFVALPGGYGTLDEIFEVLSLNYLRVQNKPFVLLDVDGGWYELVRLVTGVQRRGFADPCFDRLCTVVDDAVSAIDAVERLAALARSSWSPSSGVGRRPERLLKATRSAARRPWTATSRRRVEEA
jgi:predicted Rossmann-fold nucleotide-binding protein